mmetsp:Transcript_21820/g.24357  ORF Transcript_21820/g.24357 Transcript_21820/m.24357 type:complete len:254 (+) Transcript_21820:36-797(+)
MVSLHDDILITICSHFSDVRDLGAFAGVCKHWCNLSSHNHVWKYRVAKEMTKYRTNPDQPYKHLARQISNSSCSKPYSHYGIKQTIKDGYTVVQSTGGSSYVCARFKHPWTSSNYIEMKILGRHSSSSMCIGVLGRTKEQMETGELVLGTGHIASTYRGWSFRGDGYLFVPKLHQGQKYSNSGFNTQHNVGIMYDDKERTITFYVNGKSQGVACTFDPDVICVYPAVEFWSHLDVIGIIPRAWDGKPPKVGHR